MWSNLFILFLFSARPFQTGLNHPLPQTGSTGRQVCKGIGLGDRDKGTDPAHLGSGWGLASMGRGFQTHPSHIQLLLLPSPGRSKPSRPPPSSTRNSLASLAPLPRPADSNILVNVFCLWPHLTPSPPCAGLSWPTSQAGISLLPEEMGSSSGTASRTS